MRFAKSLLFALALGTGTAFAGQDSSVQGSVETSPTEDAYRGAMPEGPSDELALEEGDVIYLIPVEVTEYYILIPSESSEMPG
jgi:hypothetical protein